MIRTTLAHRSPPCSCWRCRRRPPTTASPTPTLRASVTVTSRRGAGRRPHRQCRLGRADRGLSLARPRHHRRAAGRPGPGRAPRQAGDRRDDRRHQGSPGHPACPHARQQGSRKRGRLCARAPLRPWRRRQHHRHLRPRHLRHAARCLQHRRAAAGRDPLRRRAAAASTSPSRSTTTTTRRRPSCA